MVRSIFVTGFGPFGAVTENPSQKLAEGCGLEHAVLPVGFQDVDQFLDSFSATTFDILLLLGVAATREHMCPELFARNIIGKAPDIHGVNRHGPIVEGGPLLLETTLWNASDVADWSVRLPVQASQDAGNYLCNYIYYQALSKFPNTRIGFLHVPTEAKLPFETQISVLTQIVQVLED